MIQTLAVRNAQFSTLNQNVSHFHSKYIQHTSVSEQCCGAAESAALQQKYVFQLSCKFMNCMWYEKDWPMWNIANKLVQKKVKIYI